MNFLIVLLLLAVWVTNGQNEPRQDSCTNPNDKPGVCLSIRKCSSLITLLMKHRKHAEVRNFLRESVCGYDGGDPKVCCPEELETVVQPTPIKIKSAIPSTPERTTSNPIRDNADLQSSQLPKNCGKNNPVHSYVVGGTIANRGTWPWMAALGYKSKNDGNKPTFRCSGSLITDRHVLTAAHCLPKNMKLLLVRLGVVGLYDHKYEDPPVDARISRVIVHEKYNARTFTNDIGIIELDKPVAFNLFIQPVCLPLSRQMRSLELASTKMSVAGWGQTSFGGPSSGNLMQLTVPVLEEVACQRAFEPFRTAVIDKRILCAGVLTGGYDTCRGDSGGPLVDSIGPIVYQFGVVSYGYKCAEPGFPGVYTRVTEFVDWIVNKIEKK